MASLLILPLARLSAGVRYSLIFIPEGIGKFKLCGMVWGKSRFRRDFDRAYPAKHDFLPLRPLRLGG